MKIIVSLMMCLLTIPAMADDSVKPWTTDMTTVLIDQDGAPIKDQFDRKSDDPDCAHCKVLTLGEACAHSLFSVGPDEKDVTAEQRWAWSIFAEKIRHDPKAVLNSAESELLYKRLGHMYGGVVLMRAMPLIDPNRKPPEIK